MLTSTTHFLQLERKKYFEASSLATAIFDGAPNRMTPASRCGASSLAVVPELGDASAFEHVGDAVAPGRLADHKPGGAESPSRKQIPIGRPMRQFQPLTFT